MAEVLRMICAIKPLCSPPALLIASRKLCACCSSIIISVFTSSILAERRSSFSLSSLSPAQTGAAMKDIRIKRQAILDGDFMLIITLSYGESWNEERDAGAAFSIPYLPRQVACHFRWRQLLSNRALAIVFLGIHLSWCGNLGLTVV